MKKILGILALSLFLLSCNGRKNANEISPDEFEDGHMPPPPPPDGKHPDGPPPPPPDGKGHPPHEPDNMRGFDPASEDDMDDNGMSRYMENNDDSGWD